MSTVVSSDGTSITISDPDGSVTINDPDDSTVVTGEGDGAPGPPGPPGEPGTPGIPGPAGLDGTAAVEELIGNLGTAAFENVGTTSDTVAAGDAAQNAVDAMPTVDTTDNAKASFSTVDVGGGEFVTFLDVSNLASLADVGAGGGLLFTFTQDVSSSLWLVGHNLGAYVNVTVVDSLVRVVEADVQYVDENNITIGFTTPATGQAFLS